MAFGVSAAGQKLALGDFAKDHRLAALVANLLSELSIHYRFTISIEIQCRFAFRVTAAP
jgi:hypothetical protein